MLAGVEQELVDLVKAETALAGRLRAVDVVDVATPQLLRRMISLAPAVYVLVRDARLAQNQVTLTTDLLCLSRNARGGRAARDGDGATIGAYEIADALLALLDGSRWRPTRAQVDRSAAWADAGVAAVLITAEASETADTAIDESTLDDFVTFDAVHDLDTDQTGEPEANDHLTGLDQL
jgi:hypothetical protein